MGRTKSAVTTRKKTVAAVGTAATAEIGTIATIKTTAVVRTAVAVAGAPKIFKKEAIITAGEKTSSVTAMTSRRGSAASFNREEKYIWINDDAAAFALGGK